MDKIYYYNSGNSTTYTHYEPTNNIYEQYTFYNSGGVILNTLNQNSGNGSNSSIDSDNVWYNLLEYGYTFYSSAQHSSGSYLEFEFTINTPIEVTSVTVGANSTTGWTNNYIDQRPQGWECWGVDSGTATKLVDYEAEPPYGGPHTQTANQNVTTKFSTFRMRFYTETASAQNFTTIEGFIIYGSGQSP